jgi:hypothetical protein
MLIMEVGIKSVEDLKFSSCALNSCKFLIIIMSRDGMTVDGVLIGNQIYSILYHTD